MIQTILTGRLGKDAETRQAGTTQVINFTVAVDTGYGEKKKTLWLDCSKFGDNVKVAEYLKKGQQVLIVGEPDIRTWDKDGKHGAAMTVRVQTIELIGSRETNTTSETTYAPNAAGVLQPSDDFDLF